MRLARQQDVLGAAGEVGFVLFGQRWDWEGVPAPRGSNIYGLALSSRKRLRPTLVSGERERPLDEADQLAVVYGLGLVSPVGLVMELIRVAQDVIEFLSPLRIEDLIPPTDVLPAQIGELAEHLAGREVVWVDESRWVLPLPLSA